MKRALVRSFALLCLSATILAPLLTHARAGEVDQATADVQKLDAAMSFMRGRNARDYAIATPDGIDEGRYVGTWRNRTVDHHSR